MRVPAWKWHLHAQSRARPGWLLQLPAVPVPLVHRARLLVSSTRRARHPSFQPVVCRADTPFCKVLPGRHGCKEGGGPEHLRRMAASRVGARRLRGERAGLSSSRGRQECGHPAVHAQHDGGGHSASALQALSQADAVYPRLCKGMPRALVPIPAHVFRVYAASNYANLQAPLSVVAAAGASGARRTDAQATHLHRPLGEWRDPSPVGGCQARADTRPSIPRPRRVAVADAQEAHHGSLPERSPTASQPAKPRSAHERDP